MEVYFQGKSRFIIDESRILCYNSCTNAQKETVSMVKNPKTPLCTALLAHV